MITRYDRAVLARAVAALRSISMAPDTASWVHSAAMKALDEAGFRVEHEHAVEGGRIDIVAFDLATGEPVAIEIDARKPRKGSLRKLREFDGWRVAASRGVDLIKPDGIDAVCSISVREASEGQRASKRGVKLAAAALKARNT